MSLKGKVALVTASTRGIGRATAERLATQGAHVFVNGRSADNVDRAVDEITKAGGKVSGIVADLSSAEGVAQLIKQLPTVDILINNLGVGDFGATFWEMTDEHFERHFQINVMSGIRLCRHYLKPMIEKNEGRVVFISSIFAKDPSETMAIHLSICDAAKAITATALAQLTRNTNVTVNSVMPGFVATDGAKEVFNAYFQTDDPPTLENFDKHCRKSFPQQLIGRAIRPSEVALPICYQPGDDSKHCSTTEGLEFRKKDRKHFKLDRLLGLWRISVATKLVP